MPNPKDAALKAALGDLSDEERARLPGRLRAMDRDGATVAWNEAKRERDEAIAAVTEKVEVEQNDALGNPYVTISERYTDHAAVAAAHERWTARKAELLAQMEG